MGDYRFASEDDDLVQNDYYNVRPVEWLKVLPRTSFSKAALHSFVSLFLDHYDQLDPAWRSKFPLKRAFVPFR